MERKSGDTLHLDLHRTLNLVKTRSRSFRSAGGITISLALAMAGAYLFQSISACASDEELPVERRGSFAAVTLIAPQFVLKQRNTLAFTYSGIANLVSPDTAPCFRWSKGPYTRPVTGGDWTARGTKDSLKLLLPYYPLAEVKPEVNSTCILTERKEVGKEESAFRFSEFRRSLSPYLPSGRRRVSDIFWKTETFRDKISIFATRSNHLGLFPVKSPLMEYRRDQVFHMRDYSMTF